MILTRKLRADIRGRREPTVLIAGKQMPGSIPFLMEMLETVSSPHDRDELLGELAGEYLRADLEDEHLAVQRERVANHPDAAIKWLGLAHSLSMRKDGADEAKQAVAKGIEISRATGSLIRYSLNCQADIARRIGDSSLFQQTLRELIADAGNHREDDCGLDDSFLANLREGFCSPELEALYRNNLARIDPSGE